MNLCSYLYINIQMFVYICTEVHLVFCIINNIENKTYQDLSFFRERSKFLYLKKCTIFLTKSMFSKPMIIFHSKVCLVLTFSSASLHKQSGSFDNLSSINGGGKSQMYTWAEPSTFYTLARQLPHMQNFLVPNGI